VSETGTVSRFTGVQVYVHFLMALSILVLILTGLAITFNHHVWWITAIVGYQNVVLVHVIAGVLLFGSLVYYVVYALTGLFAGEFPTAWLPGRDTVDEVLAYANWVVGRGEKPDAGKYTWVQKSEMLIISGETTVMILTGLLLTFPGLLLAYKPAYLPVSDVHAVVAYTLTMGVSFHLYDRHVEHFPLDTSMFTGRVSVARAREEWSAWVDAEGADGDGVDHPGPSLRLVALAILLFVYLALVSGVLVSRVFAPLPTTDHALWVKYSPEAILEGTFGLVWTIGFNVVALVVLAGIVALLYGLSLRLTESTQ
jgi:formate dehydrogenase subunit gamma